MAAKRTLENRQCLHCGGTFRPPTSASAYCSSECWYASRKAARMVPCEACGTTFERKVKTQRACSVACGNKLKEANRTVECGNCKTAFLRPHGKLQTFCSRRCSMLARGGSTSNSAARHPEGHELRTSSGYIQQKHEGRWVQQHRLVMQQTLGRPLLSNERVHHKNGVRADNRPENLEMWAVTATSKKDPAGQRVCDKIKHVLAQSTIDPDQRAALYEALSSELTGANRK